MLRSLDPLPDEALSGYLLRLSHRLRITPATLVKRTGLGIDTTADSKVYRISMHYLFALEPECEEPFARATRLSPAEVQGLLLAPLGRRYGPLNPRFLKSAEPSRVIRNNSWVLSEKVRYCPQCLAGDGSEIEALHGGAWRRLWRLPVTFACVRHRQLLRDRCPDCGGLVHAGDAKSMLARLNDDALHPTQCRSTPSSTAKDRSVRPACGADLTAAEGGELRSLSPQTRRTIYTTQERLTSLLADDGPEQIGSVGWAVPVAQYFMDLKAVTSLIFMTWPEARPHAATPTLAQALDAEAQRRHEDFAQQRAAGKRGPAARAYVVPSADPLAAAAVFEMADRFLRSSDENAASALLGPLAEEARYAHQPVSYTIRRAQGTSIPLQIVLLTHRRNARSGENVTTLIERNEGLARWPTSQNRLAK
ncbi:TniQ family protein [Streptomyces sp. CBMA152]|uniref:TniQ family protein n=1 Tax=Streptomyces sp. CBMA152 TaxID=1896312 RepID=UPI001CB707CF|nr:TniQ family protein [Streptomyces sp. CBMA152]